MLKKLVFDGEATFKTYFEAVSAKGSRDEWMKIAKGVRSGGITGRLVLASAFASTLVKPFGALPFFCPSMGRHGGRQDRRTHAGWLWANPEADTFTLIQRRSEKSAGL